jgi:hypothetical protein
MAPDWRGSGGRRRRGSTRGPSSWVVLAPRVRLFPEYAPGSCCVEVASGSGHVPRPVLTSSCSGMARRTGEARVSAGDDPIHPVVRAVRVGRRNHGPRDLRSGTRSRSSIGGGRPRPGGVDASTATRATRARRGGHRWPRPSLHTLTPAPGMAARWRDGQASSGIARSLVRAAAQPTAQGQRAGRCSDTLRAERVSRPARPNSRRRRV